MEPHKASVGTDNPPNLSDGPKAYFSAALKFVEDNYRDELERISSVKFEEVDDDFFFREYVWVVHATGFSAKAVGNFMPRLLKAYGWWDKLAFESFDDVMGRVAKVCNNKQKAKAIFDTAGIMKNALIPENRNKAILWNDWKNENLSSPELLSKLPYIGKVTCFHLARNIGLLDFVKPDLHLVRMAKFWGFVDAVDMCKFVQPGGMPLGVVDLILWYSASTFGTVEIRQDGDR